jgi:hypothetical protein
LKKFICAATGIIIIAAIVLSFGGCIFDNPEKQIIGKWMDATDNYGFIFAEDKTVTFPLEFFDLGFEADINGTYAIDKKADTITFTFSAFSISYDKTYTFLIKGDSLTLTNTKSGTSTVFTKQADAG